jgi:2-phosphoglycerate kinase
MDIRKDGFSFLGESHRHPFPYISYGWWQAQRGGYKDSHSLYGFDLQSNLVHAGIDEVDRVRRSIEAKALRI